MQFQFAVPDPEEQARQHAEVVARNEAKERARIAAANRAAGHAEPKPGDRLYVSLALRDIKSRSRAGVTFEEGKRTEVLVVDVEDTETARADLAARHKAGDKVASVAGAELILADTGLNVRPISADDVDAGELRAQLARMTAERDQARQDYQRAIAEARRAAPESTDGSPSKLRAADKARAKLGSPPGKDDDGFGGGGSDR